MRRPGARSLLVVGAVAPLLWAVPASADPGYPPTGPSGGGGGETFGGGTVTPNLPRTGQDLQSAALLGGGSVLAGGLVLIVAARSRRSAASR